MNRTILLLMILVLVSCQQNSPQKVDRTAHEKAVTNTLNQWHQAAAQADFDTYFGLMTDDAVFVGTDATEHWTGQTFKDFSKPYFDRGKAWSFTPLQRHIYLSENGGTAWFDELLDTQMGLCRGSGVAIKQEQSWHVAHYVLSITVPNEEVDSLKAVKETYKAGILKTLHIP